MGDLKLSDFAPGDYVNAYTYSGGRVGWDSAQVMLFQVVRVNRKTVTVRDCFTNKNIRVEPHHFNSKVSAENARNYHRA